MRDERMDGWKAGRMEGLADGQTHNPEAIGSLSFFEVGGIKRIIDKKIKLLKILTFLQWFNSISATNNDIECYMYIPNSLIIYIYFLLDDSPIARPVIVAW